MSKEIWNDRYKRGGNSGDGSYGDQLEKKLTWLAEIKDKVKSITEVGCGDFNFGNALLEIMDASYVGLDISDFIIEKNKKNHPLFVFDTYPKVIPKADLLLCVDVFFHVLDKKDLDNLMRDLKESWTKYLVVTAYEHNNTEVSPHVRIRKFDPAYFGEPIFRQIIEEDGELYFYIFKKNE